MKHEKEKHKLSKDERKAAEARICTQNIRQLMIGFRSRLEDAIREESLTLPQLRLLKAIQEQKDVSAAALARMCSVTPQTLQAILVRVEQAKWIVRGKSQRNERFMTATLTPLGEAALESGMAMAASLEKQIWQDLSLADLKELNGVLEAGIANLEGPPVSAP